MSSRFPLRGALCVAIGWFPLAVLACGARGPIDDNIEAYDAIDASGLQPPGDDASVPEDAGKKPVDAGKDGSVKDASKDAAKDTGLPGFPGFPGLPGLSEDAGGIIGCFACAQDQCGTQVDACIADQACLQEGICDLTTCLGGMTTGTGGGGGGLLGGLNLQCFMTCGPNQAASSELISALQCTFTSCGTECLSALTMAGGAGGGLGGLGGLGGGGLGGGGLGGLGGLGGFGATN
jgi:hypothetical protein